MKVLIDVAHPAHVHYFKNFAKEFIKKGHSVLFTANDRSLVQYLLEKYELPYEFRGHRASSTLGKVKASFYSYKKIYQIAKKFNPDIFLDMGTVYAAPVARILGKPYIAMDDTEASGKARFLHMPFTTNILTPEAFYLNLGKKQIRFNGNMELLYLHPNRYVPDQNILKLLKIVDEPYIVVRFIAWDAHHDINKKGLSAKDKKELIKILNTFGKVFISSESELPHELKKLKLKVPPEKMHDVLAFASLYVGEGATMASECAMLRTPVIYINEIFNGYLKEEESAGLLYKLEKSDHINNSIEKMLSKNYKTIHKEFLSKKIDVTAFLVWFVEHYPESVRVMCERPEYQWRFR